LKIKKLKGSDYKRNVKCSIHLSGKMGFSQAAIDELNLSNNKFIEFGINEENENDTTLFMFILDNEEKDAFKLIKAGNYYYLNTKKMFDDLGLDYKNKTYIYDISKIIYEDQTVYKLSRRESDRRNKN
jgi:hypothetical protein